MFSASYTVLMVKHPKKNMETWITPATKVVVDQRKRVVPHQQ